MSIIQNGNIFQADIEELASDSKNSFLVDKDTSAYEYDFISESQAYQFRHPSVKKEIVPINEATRKEILKEAEFKRKLRAKKLTCRYVGVTNDRGWIKFITNSQYTPGKKYFQYIKLAEAKDMKKFKDFKPREIIRLFLSGDLQCYCNCLRHDTQIKLLDGRIMSVEDMTLAFESGEDLWVYSVDEKGNFKPGKVSNVWITGKSKSFVRITLDNGKSLEITENHLIFMRDGSYKAAKDISIGDSLMPLYFKDMENGYKLVKHNSFPDSGWHSVYKDVAEECFSDNDYREARERPLDAFGSLKNLLDYLGEPYSTYNHKVVSVDVINVPIEENVYDITVEKYHNFYVDAGCILHNCADYKYRQKYVAWGLGFGIFKELRFPRKTNPSLEGGVCKHLIAVLNIMMMNHMAIERDMLKSKFFKRKSQDAEYMKELKAKQAQRKSKKKNG